MTLGDTPAIRRWTSLPRYNVTSEGVVRKWFVTDKDGVEHQIRNQADLDAIMAQMTPEQREIFLLGYRFAPIQNLTGIRDYTGTIKDLM